MHIRRVEVSAIRLSLSEEVFTAYGSFSYQDILLVQVITRDGIIGIGEVPSGGTMNYGGFNSESVGADIINSYAKRIVGKEFNSPLDAISILDKPASRSQEEREISSKAPLDIALYDLHGKMQNLSVSDIIGRRLRSELKVGQIISSKTPEQMVEEIQKYFDRGFRSFKVKLSGDAAQDRLRIEMIRSNFGEKLVLWADANEQWTEEETIDWCKSLAPYQVDYLEQPVPGWDIEGLAKVRKAIRPTRIIADQSIFSVYDAKKVLQHGGADVLTLKVMRLGITKAMSVAKLAEENAIECKIGAGGEGAVGGAAAIHIARVIPNLSDCNELSFPNYSYLPFEGLVPVDEGGTAWTVKEKPGLGIEPKKTLKLSERPIAAINE